MSNIEAQVYRLVDAGDFVEYIVIPKYIGNSLAPDSLRIVAKVDGQSVIDEVIFNW